jgi:hypothetical protein
VETSRFCGECEDLELVRALFGPLGLVVGLALGWCFGSFGGDGRDGVIYFGFGSRGGDKNGVGVLI